MVMLLMRNIEKPTVLIYYLYVDLNIAFEGDLILFWSYKK